MSEPKHECDRDNDNIIFYSALWKSWALKVITDMEFPTIFITIKYCPYCGEDLNECPYCRDDLNE